jgi:hypothetical protein
MNPTKWTCNHKYLLFRHVPPDNKLSEPVLFADDTCVTISSSSFEHSCSVSNLVISRMIKWVAANKLVLNLDKTNIMQSRTDSISHCMRHIDYKEKNIEETVNGKFLGLQIDITT